MPNKRRTISPLRKRTVVFAFLIALLAVSPSLAQQFPDKFENLQILPKDIARGELREIMRGFTVALGVRCGHCHVGEEGARPPSFDFASDDKSAKQAARVMIEMVKAINETHLAKLGEESGHHHSPRVECVSCHEGRSEPHLLGDLLADTYSHEGVQAVIREYGDWRSEYEDALSNVQDQTLASFAQQLAVAEGKPEDAIAILKSNLESHPQSATTYFVLGEIYRMQRKPDLARENFEKVLELEPENRRARARLRQMSGQRQRRR